MDGAGDDEVVEFSKSALGTKEYWDQYYARDLALMDEGGDGGDTWFGEQVLRRMVDAVPKLLESQGPDAAILDAKKGFTNVLGTDYSADAIRICERMAAEASVTTVRFVQDDLLRSALPPASFDLVTDKGTLDAICLNGAVLDPPRAYARAVAALVRPSGRLLVTSCNWTEAELQRILAPEFTPLFAVPHPKFRFGGREGSAVATVAFARSGPGVPASPRDPTGPAAGPCAADAGAALASPATGRAGPVLSAAHQHGAQLAQALAARVGLGVQSSVHADGRAPQAALVSLAASPQLEFVFCTGRESRKARNLAGGGPVALVLAHERATLQVEGEARPLSGADLERGRALFLRRFPEHAERIQRSGDALCFFGVRPQWMRVTDYGASVPFVIELDEAALLAVRSGSEGVLESRL